MHALCSLDEGSSFRCTAAASSNHRQWMTGHPLHCVVLIVGPHTFQTSTADQMPQRLSRSWSERQCQSKCFITAVTLILILILMWRLELVIFHHFVSTPIKSFSSYTLRAKGCKGSLYLNYKRYLFSLVSFGICTGILFVVLTALKMMQCHRKVFIGTVFILIV